MRVIGLLMIGAASVGSPLLSATDEGKPAATVCASAEQPVHVEEFVPSGGIEQWVTINGKSCANPVILFLHGGPGNTLSPYADSIFGSWEKSFTLVQWDQEE